MRKLLTIAALLTASTVTFWQPQPAMAGVRAEVIITHHHHHRHWRHHTRYYYEYRR